MDRLVTTQWLADAIGPDGDGAADLVLLDATYFLPGDRRNAAAEYRDAHIPGALFMDLAALADPDTDLPSMLPPADLFAAAMGRLGIAADTRVVLYDRSPYTTAARAWFLLRTFGATRVALLDGGWDKWQAEGRAVSANTETPAAATFTPRTDYAGVRSLHQMTANLAGGDEQVVDARSAPRFAGMEPEPRAGTVPGHIPRSANLPYKRLFRPDGTWKTGDELRAVFTDAGVDLNRPLVTTCGSGITASALAFAAHLLDVEAAVYDGSWAEWGADPSTPKATGPA